VASVRPKKQEHVKDIYFAALGMLWVWLSEDFVTEDKKGDGLPCWTAFARWDFSASPSKPFILNL